MCVIIMFCDYFTFKLFVYLISYNANTIHMKPRFIIIIILIRRLVMSDWVSFHFMFNKLDPEVKKIKNP